MPIELFIRICEDKLKICILPKTTILAYCSLYSIYKRRVPHGNRASCEVLEESYRTTGEH